jgi:hypothetical protein
LPRLFHDAAKSRQLFSSAQQFYREFTASFSATLIARFSDILPHTYPGICRDHQLQFFHDHIRAITGRVDASISARLADNFPHGKSANLPR